MTPKQIEMLSELRDYMKTVPDDEFLYREFFGRGGRWFFPQSIEEIKTGCGTVACLAGHACVLWKEYLRKDLEFGMLCVGSVTEFLEIGQDLEDFLFYRNCGEANRLDAIRRLEWVIEGKEISDYDFSQEN